MYLYIHAFHMQKRSYDTFKLNNILLFYSGSFGVRPHKLHVKYTIFYKGFPYFIFPKHWETGTKQSHTRNMRELVAEVTEIYSASIKESRRTPQEPVQSYTGVEQE